MSWGGGLFKKENILKHHDKCIECEVSSILSGLSMITAHSISEQLERKPPRPQDRSISAVASRGSEGNRLLLGI